MIYNAISRILSIVVLSVFFTVDRANAVHWTVTGPGVTNVLIQSNKVIFSYDLTAFLPFATVLGFFGLASIRRRSLLRNNP